MKANRSNRPARRNDGRVIGTLEGTTLRLKRKRSKHLYRALDAWSIDLVTLVRAADAGVESVVVEDVESGETFEVALDDFLHYGIPVDHGSGTQLALPLQYWLRSTTLQLRFGL
jgi:hypothetical protein